jgi:hypothetical protein
MKKLFSGRIFADHYQFYISDAKADLLEKSLDWMANDNAKRGYSDFQLSEVHPTFAFCLLPSAFCLINQSLCILSE